MEKKVSVVIPVYNVEEYLAKCLESVCSQSYSNIEILLINDGSTDSSAEICQEYAKRDSRIIVVNKQNGGHTSARKAGVERASGEYLCFVDSDDWVEEGMIEALVDAITAGDAEMATANFVYEYEDFTKRKKSGGNLEPGVYTGENYQEIFVTRMFYGSPIHGWGIGPALWGKLFVTEKFKPYILELDEQMFYGEDVASLYPYCLSIHSAVVIDYEPYHYRVREDSVSRKKNPMIFDNLCRLHDHLYKSFSEHPQKAVLMQQLEYYLLLLCNHAVGMQTCFTGNMESVYWRQVENFGRKVLPEYQQQGTGETGGSNRSGNPYAWTSIYLVPFHKIPNDAKFILFGAGYIGKSFAWQLERSKRKEQWVAWMDTGRACERLNDARLTCIDKISEYEYDYVILAAADQGVEETMREFLKGKGVLEERMIWDHPEQLNGILIRRGENK